MSENTDALDTMLDAFLASWPEPRMKDPSLTLVLGNLRGFVGFLRERGYRLSPPQIGVMEALSAMPCYGCSTKIGDSSEAGLASSRGCVTCKPARAALAKA